MSRLILSQISEHNGEIHLCYMCFNHCQSKDVSKKHKEYCINNKAVKIEMPVKGAYQIFDNHARSMRVPFVVYADFEWFPEKSRIHGNLR